MASVPAIGIARMSERNHRTRGRGDDSVVFAMRMPYRDTRTSVCQEYQQSQGTLKQHCGAPIAQRGHPRELRHNETLTGRSPRLRMSSAITCSGFDKPGFTVASRTGWDQFVEQFHATVPSRERSHSHWAVTPDSVSAHGRERTPARSGSSDERRAPRLLRIRPTIESSRRSAA
jgi:hypothetical protein